MLRITIPNNNIAERSYIVDIIFNEFLGLEYQLEYGAEHYEITVGNKTFEIKDTFFNEFPNDLEYLKLENIPQSIEELDVFAASFFMLTRWEEYVDKTRDIHGRFPASASLAYREGFLKRPIVDEMVDTLKQDLQALDPGLNFKKRSFEFVPTHDVDHLCFWKDTKRFFRVIAGDLLKRRNVSMALRHTGNYFSVKSGKAKDPYDTFDWLMDLSEDAGIRSRFYFMSGGRSLYDNHYRIEEASSLIRKIQKRGHIVGIHPSYDSFNDITLFEEEKASLEKIVGTRVTEGRQHFLRFEVPVTWQIWDDHGMTIDSTCGYADMPGYRCGTGEEFTVFNILTRKKLKLKERPLVVMDCTLFDYNGLEEESAWETMQDFRENEGTLTVLWHNSYIERRRFYRNFFHAVAGSGKMKNFEKKR